MRRHAESKHPMSVRAIVLIVALLALPRVWAEESSGQMFVEIAAQTTEDTATSGEIAHVFGGQSVPLRLIVYGAPGQPLDLQAKLFQLADGLAAPVGDDIALSSGVEFSHTLRRELPVSIAVPIVEREATFQILIQGRHAAAEPWQPVAKANLRVYPRNLLKSLQVLAERQALRVVDPTGTLSDVLTAQQIQVMDLAAPPPTPTTPTMILVVGNGEDVAALKRPLQVGESIILFKERAETLPRIEVKASGQGTLVTVHMQLVGRLATDPRAQKLLLELIQMAQGQTNSVTGGGG